MNRIGKSIEQNYKLSLLLCFAMATVLVYFSTINSAVYFSYTRYKDVLNVFCLNLTPWRRALFAVAAVISVLPYCYWIYHDRVLLDSGWAKLGLMLSVCLVIMVATTPHKGLYSISAKQMISILSLEGAYREAAIGQAIRGGALLSGSVQSRLIFTAPINLIFPLAICAAVEMVGKTAANLLWALIAALGGLALSSCLSESYYLYAVLAMCAATSMIGEKHGKAAGRSTLAASLIIGGLALSRGYGEILFCLASALILYAAVITVVEMRGKIAKLFPAIVVSIAILAISWRFESTSVSVFYALVLFVLVGVLIAGRWKTAAVLLFSLVAAISMFELVGVSVWAVLLVLAVYGFRWGLSEKEQPEMGECREVWPEAGRDLIVIGSQLMAVYLIVVAMLIFSPLHADGHNRLETAACVLSLACVLYALILQEIKGRAKAEPYLKALPLQLFIMLGIWVKQINVEIDSNRVLAGLAGCSYSWGVDVRLDMWFIPCIACMIYTMHYLYDYGMKGRPRFYLITTGALIALLYFPAFEICGEISSVSIVSTLIGLASPTMITAVGFMNDWKARRNFLD